MYIIISKILYLREFDDVSRFERFNGLILIFYSNPLSPSDAPGTTPTLQGPRSLKDHSEVMFLEFQTNGSNGFW
jgi:hypothetical protein